MTLKNLLIVILSGLLILTAIISVGSLIWKSYPLELLSSFRVYYFLLSSAIAIVLLFLKNKDLAPKLLLYISLVLVAFNSVWIFPWYIPSFQSSTDNQIRVLTFNIHAANNQWDKIANDIIAVRPDVATITECSERAKKNLSSRLSQLLPFAYRSTQDGLTIFSKFELLAPDSKTFTDGTILLTSMSINQKPVKFIAAHPVAPVTKKYFRRRNVFVEEITNYLQEQKLESLIFMGDFNLTPWSSHYIKLIKSSQLHNTRLGFGVEPSWIEFSSNVHQPRWLIKLIQIPIDHIFVSQNIRVLDCHTVIGGNSDHRILWSDVAI